jgi:hypothetical protein
MVFSYLQIQAKAHRHTQIKPHSTCAYYYIRNYRLENLPMAQEQNDQDKYFDRFSFSSTNMYLKGYIKDVNIIFCDEFIELKRKEY